MKKQSLVLFYPTLFCLVFLRSLGKRPIRKRRDGEIWRGILGCFRNVKDAGSQLGYKEIVVNPISNLMVRAPLGKDKGRGSVSIRTCYGARSKGFRVQLLVGSLRASLRTYRSLSFPLREMGTFPASPRVVLWIKWDHVFKMFETVSST